MASFHRRGTGYSRMRWHTAVKPKNGVAVHAANELPSDFNPAEHDGERFDAASLGDASVNLWYSMSLYDGFVEEHKVMLMVGRGRFRL